MKTSEGDGPPPWGQLRRLSKLGTQLGVCKDWGASPFSLPHPPLFPFQSGRARKEGQDGEPCPTSF